MNNIVEVNDVRMTAKFFEERDFTNSGRGNALVFHVQTNLLDRNHLLGFVIKSFVNNPISPLAELIEQVVSLHGGVFPLSHIVFFCVLGGQEEGQVGVLCWKVTK